MSDRQYRSGPGHLSRQNAPTYYQFKSGVRLLLPSRVITLSAMASEIALSPRNSALEALPAEIRLKVYSFVLAQHECSLHKPALIVKRGRHRSYELDLDECETAFGHQVTLRDDMRPGPPTLEVVFECGRKRIARRIDVQHRNDQKRLVWLTQICKTMRTDLVPLIGAKLLGQMEDVSAACWFSVNNQCWAHEITMLTIQYEIGRWERGLLLLSLVALSLRRVGPRNYSSTFPIWSCSS